MSMIARAIAALLTASVLATAAHADTNYTVLTPTVEPYTKFQNFVSPGAFTDSFNFTLQSAIEGYLWLFPKQDAWFGSSADNTTGVTFTLVNNDTETQVAGVLYPVAKAPVSIFTPGVLGLIAAGFDPNKSLYIAGTFAPGNYSALVSGLATGSQGGSYVVKFNLAPVPEAGTSLMMLLGLAGVAAVVKRKGAGQAA
jgi:hypothetical protein